MFLYIIISTRRGRGAKAPTSVPESSDTDSGSLLSSSSSTGTVVEVTREDANAFNQTENTEKLALKLNNKYDKLARYKSHLELLSTCVQEKLIPRGFQIQLDPSIGNHDEAFLNALYQKNQQSVLRINE